MELKNKIGRIYISDDYYDPSYLVSFNYSDSIKGVSWKVVDYNCQDGDCTITTNPEYPDNSILYTDIFV